MVQLAREQGLLVLSGVAGCPGTVSLRQSPSKLQERHHLVRQRYQRKSLRLAKVPNLIVKDAQRSNRDAFLGLHRSAQENSPSSCPPPRGRLQKTRSLRLGFVDAAPPLFWVAVAFGEDLRARRFAALWMNRVPLAALYLSCNPGGRATVSAAFIIPAGYGRSVGGDLVSTLSIVGHYFLLGCFCVRGGTRR
jgi:hypothetical protein